MLSLDSVLGSSDTAMAPPAKPKEKKKKKTTAELEAERLLAEEEARKVEEGEQRCHAMR